MKHKLTKVHYVYIYTYYIQCQDQTWNPKYQDLNCGGVKTAKDLMYCRLKSATCQPLPPGLQPNATSTWTCIPDVWNELSDPMTSLNDCDCNCGDMDPDCMANYNNIYCSESVDKDGNPIQIPWGQDVSCKSDRGKVVCDGIKAIDDNSTATAVVVAAVVLDCPQLPQTSPAQLSFNSKTGAQYSSENPPPGWTCSPEKYYELAAGRTPVCDCECGVIDPVSKTQTNTKATTRIQKQQYKYPSKKNTVSILTMFALVIRIVVTTCEAAMTRRGIHLIRRSSAVANL